MNANGAIGVIVSKLRWYILALFLLSLFYWLTAPGNMSEAEDDYWYASTLEHFRFDGIADSRDPLFFIVTHFLLLAARLFNRGIDEFQLLTWFSIVTGAAAVVLFHRYLRSALRLGNAASLFGAAILAFTYGFWRYASIPEVYAPSIFLIMLVLLLNRHCDGTAEGGSGSGRIGSMTLCGALGGVAVLLYRPICLVLFFAYPLAVLRPKRIPALFAYGVAGLGMTILGYFLMFANLHGATLSTHDFYNYIFRRDNEFKGNDLSAETIFLGVLTFVRMIVAAKWAFGVDWIVKAFGSAVSVNADNELYQAAHAGWLPYAGLALSGPLLLVGVWLVVIAVRRSRRTSALSAGAPRGWLFVWWLLFGFGTAFVLVPTAYELYILPLPAVAGLAAVWVGAPVAAAGRQALLALAVVLFGTFNWVGGLAVVDGVKSDYIVRISSWLDRNAKAGDVIVVKWKHYILANRLRYITKATYIYDNNLEKLDALGAVLASGKRVFAVEETYRRPPGAVDLPWLKALQARSGLPLTARLVDENEVARTYEIVRRPPAP